MARGMGPIRWTRDISRADWWLRGLDPSYDRVDALMPARYEAYARVFHPARQGGRPVSWGALARQHGRVVHGQMRFSAISRWPGRTVADDVEAPPPSLPLPEARRLVELLRPATDTPESCWFCRWADQRWVQDAGVAERVILPSGGRDYLLHSGPIELALEPAPALIEDDGGLTQTEDEYVASRRDLTPAEMELELAAWRAARNRRRSNAAVSPVVSVHEVPTFWWPEDRRWFVATEVNLASTFIGGPGSLVQQLIDDPSLEALPARISDSVVEYDDRPNEELDRRAQPVR